MSSTFAREVLSGRRRGLLDRLAVGALLPFSAIYCGVTRLRRYLYRKGILAVRKLDRPVVSVGNITAGGTGKTPMTAYIARFFLGRGKRVAVISRGYGGSYDGKPLLVSDGASIFTTADVAGDEPVLLARSVPGLAVVVGHDRYAAGLLAQKALNPDLFILDDGFQHRRLHRDLDIVLLDYRRPFGNGHVLPAGLMREGRSALSDASAVVHTRSPKSAQKHSPDMPHWHADHRLAGLRHVAGEDSSVFPFTALREKIGVAVAGIAEPAGFFSLLAEQGVRVAATLGFPDHEAFGPVARERIAEAVHSSSAEYVIVTEKDAVKLETFAEELAVPLYAAVLALDIADGAGFEDLLLRLRWH